MSFITWFFYTLRSAWRSLSSCPQSGSRAICRRLSWRHRKQNPHLEAYRFRGVTVSLILLALFQANSFPANAKSSDNPQLYVPPQSQSISLSNLGFGPSDAARVNSMIHSINSDSPLNGKGSLMISLARRWKVDPLLIALWQFESGMGTTGINSPNNGGNMTWEAANEASGLHGCTKGPVSLGHVWAHCPTLTAGLNLWFDYMHTFYAKKMGVQQFMQLVNIYNPCSDSAPYGFVCGSEYGRAILSLIADTAGPPATIEHQDISNICSDPTPGRLTSSHKRSKSKRVSPNPSRCPRQPERRKGADPLTDRDRHGFSRISDKLLKRILDRIRQAQAGRLEALQPPDSTSAHASAAHLRANLNGRQVRSHLKSSSFTGHDNTPTANLTTVRAPQTAFGTRQPVYRPLST